MIDTSKAITFICKQSKTKPVYMICKVYYLTVYMVVSVEIDIHWVAPITVTSHGRHDVLIHNQLDDFSIACLGKHQIKIPSSALLAPWPMDSPHKGSATRKCFDVKTPCYELESSCRLQSEYGYYEHSMCIRACLISLNCFDKREKSNAVEFFQFGVKNEFESCFSRDFEKCLYTFSNYFLFR